VGGGRGETGGIAFDRGGRGRFAQELINRHMIRITGAKEEKMASAKRKEETKTKTKTEGKTEAGSKQSTDARIERYISRISGAREEKIGISRKAAKAAERFAEEQKKRDYASEFWKSLSPFHEVQPSYLDAENKANVGPIEAEVRLRVKKRAGVRHAANLQDALECKAELGFLEARLEYYMFEEERLAVADDKRQIQSAQCKDQDAKAFGPLTKFP
jgi:hypothetical protein